VESVHPVYSVIWPLHDSDLFLGQPIELLHEGVDFRIGGLDLALAEFLVGGDGGRVCIRQAGDELRSDSAAHKECEGDEADQSQDEGHHNVGQNEWCSA
jgi:hypothetical protein